jgi:iron only hydrogenase large subunit-like protein
MENEQNLTKEASELLDLTHNNKRGLVAMVAPSFIVDFDYPEIVRMLKKLGFKYVVEVARGAEITNAQLLALTKLHPDRKYITNPCPTIVRLIRNKYPQLLEYLAPIDSPMSATAKIVDKEWPGLKKVFIGPCLMKKFEANEDRKELDILAITFRDLQQVFDIKEIKPSRLLRRKLLAMTSKKYEFDIIGGHTRLYPISGGLAQSSGITKKLTDVEYDVISGPNNANKALSEFLNNKDLKLLDILNCDGGCINGPGMNSKASLDERRKRVIDFYEKKQ